MKKYLKNLIKILVFIIFLALPNSAYADQIKSIDVDVDVDRVGIGHVTETWHTIDDNKDATEKYKVITDLGDIKIRDFSVIGNGKEFSEKDPWDIDASFDQKTYKYGKLETDTGYELCWGISEFGENEFTLSYTIDPLIVRLNDYDMLHFRFIKENLDPEPDKIKITLRTPDGMVTTDEADTSNDTDIPVSFWAFGFEGESHIKDGKIVAESNGPVQYGHLMVRFPKETFDTNYTIDRDFESYSKDAVKGSDWEEESSSTGVLGAILVFIFVIFGGIALILAITLGSSRASGPYGIVNKKSLQKAKKLKDQYYRDIPYDGPIEDTYLIADNAFYDISIENYMNAFMLKWIHEGAISFGEDEVVRVIKKAKSPYIILNHEPDFQTDVEEGFYKILKQAKSYSEDGKIRQKHLEKYMSSHKAYMETYLDKVPENSLGALEKGGYFVNDRKRNKSPFASEVYRNNISITDKGIDLYENFIKFKNYLQDYSLIEERKVTEVKLWDQFMIYAAIYGISQEVYKNFTAIYPEYAELSYFDYYTITGIHNYSTHVGRTISTVVSPELTSFESAGSGGFSSFGGGGGGFGGGSGGAGGGSR